MGKCWYSSYCCCCNKTPSFYNPVVTSLLPASMKVWLTNCLLVNRVKSQTLQRFWRVVAFNIPTKVRFLVVTQPCQHLVWSVFLIWSILIGVWWYLIVILIFSFARQAMRLNIVMFTSDIHESSFVKFLHKFFAHILLLY